jgi:hypothetical protein
MDAQLAEGEIHEFDEGSWVYLGLLDSGRGIDRDLHRGVIETCESSGWPAVSWSPAQHAQSPADSARFFEGMNHAVAHADVVVVLVNGSSTMTDAELAFAYRHRRPVIALRMENEDTPASEVRAMLDRYDRALTIDCADMEECLVGLRKALVDPSFGAIIREAAGEPSSYV